MTQLTLEVQSVNGTVQATASDQGQAHLVYEKAYEPGDQIVLKSGNENSYLVIQLDDAMDPAFVFFGWKRVPVRHSF